MICLLFIVIALAFVVPPALQSFDYANVKIED